MQREQHLRGAVLVALLVLIVALLSLLARPKPYAEREDSATEADVAIDSIPLRLEVFDPNEVEYTTLTNMGIDRNIAISIIRWRSAGKVYRIKEDVAMCYNMTDSIYLLLEPYITIGEKYRYKSQYTKPDTLYKEQRAEVAYTPFLIDTATAEYLRTLGFSSRQAALIVRYREMIGGYRNFEEFAECYAVDSTMREQLRPYVMFATTEDVGVVAEESTLVNINTADSATLVALSGIGAKSAQAIIEYRTLLGGYHDISQIREINIITEENFCKFSQQIYCDSAEIEKIYINFARSKELAVHPYISNSMLKRIINNRELKGGWSTIEEMIDSKIFKSEEAARIAPYLDFGTPDTTVN
jgi:competence ComEA-like helix-hairpin-helix protein